MVEISLWNKRFSPKHSHHYYYYPCSESSHTMPDEVGEHLARDQRPPNRSVRSFKFVCPGWCPLLFSSPHSFSIGFKSWDRYCHDRTFILWFSDPILCWI